MGWMDLSCQGSEYYQTPNIDRIANEGLTFTDAYAACPVCSPTRASLLSGKYPARLGLTQYIGHDGHQLEGGERGKLLSAPYIPFLSTSEKSIGAAFKENGYQTWHVGKWHLGPEENWPLNHGFDLNIGGCHMGHPSGRGHFFTPWDIPTLENKEGDDYLTDRLGDEAVALIKEKGDQPFYMNMCFYSVHTPIQAKSEKVAKYEARAKELGIADIDPFVVCDYHPTEHQKNKRLNRRVIQNNPVYAAMIEHLDENVGKILDALDEKGIADNTIVIFTSDNGGLSTAESSPTCNAPLAEGKGWMYEGGTREPTLMRWPNQIQAGITSDAIVTSPDYYPTLLEACGLPLKPEQHVDGKSFLPVLKGEEYDRGSVFWHYPHYGNQGGTPGSSIRKGDWKLIEFFEGAVELYNLKNDLSEKRNLAAEMPDIADEMLAELKDWQKEANALIPNPNPEWTPWMDKYLNPLD